MIQLLRVRLACLGAVSALALATASPAIGNTGPVNGWGVPLTDVKADPSIRFGRLPNGLKYAIKRNSKPQGAASIRLHFAFGSLAESEQERGLAHFIEHMAFNGTTNVPENEMIKILERHGLAFGPDTNASTGFDNTTYMLDLPKVDKERLDTAMFLLRETASEIKFDPAAVERERGVILGERRSRENFQLRQYVDLIGFQLPKTPFANRLPIGTEAVLKSATAETMRNLYRRYYRPENATFVFVGDADPAEIEARIRKTFGDWKSAAPAGARMKRGEIDLNRPASFDSFTDPAVANAVQYSVALPWSDPADTIAERRRKLVEGVATAILNRRLQRLVNEAGSPLIGGGMGFQDQKEVARLTTMVVVAKDGAWKDALSVADQEVRRALQHGFTAAELKTQLADLEASYRTAAEQENTRYSAALANTIVAVIDENDFVTTPTHRYEFFKQVAASLTPGEVDAAFRRLWAGSAPLIHVSSKEPLTNNQLAAAFEASRKVAVAAPPQATAQAFAYESFGQPGTIAEDKRIADLGVRTIRFANNVRLNIKKTDFEAGRVRFHVRMGNGQLDLPLDKPGMGVMLAMTSAVGGLNKHSLEDLKEITAGKVVTLGTGIGENAFQASGSTTKGDLALQMKLSAAYLMDPGFRPEAANQWANILPVIEKQIVAQPQAVASTRLPTILANGDPRFGLPPTSILAQRSLDELRAALQPVAASAPIEVTLVGDMDEQAAIDAVAQSFGALPPRAVTKDPSPAARKASFRADRSPIVLQHEGDADQAMVAVAWPTTDDADFGTVIGLGMLSNVLQLKLTEIIREQLGSSYGVGVGSNMSDTYPGFGYILVNAVVAPDKADEVQKAIAAAAAELRDKPVDADLLTRARTPMLESIDRSRRENGFWIGALATAQSKPERLERVRRQRALVEAIAPAELQKLARRYLTSSTLQPVLIVSDKVKSAQR
jgi:zinc protease